MHISENRSIFNHVQVETLSVGAFYLAFNVNILVLLRKVQSNRPDVLAFETKQGYFCIRIARPREKARENSMRESKGGEFGAKQKSKCTSAGDHFVCLCFVGVKREAHSRCVAKKSCAFMRDRIEEGRFRGGP